MIIDGWIGVHASLSRVGAVSGGDCDGENSKAALMASLRLLGRQDKSRDVRRGRGARKSHSFNCLAVACAMFHSLAWGATLAKALMRLGFSHLAAEL
jgi:hypothetical protein